MTRSLVIGATGYVGGHVVRVLSGSGVEVHGSSRREGRRHLQLADGADLDRVSGAYDQVVVTAQLTGPDADWILDRVDGPRWLVFSSMQLAAATPAPNTALALAREATALARGACVVRPTMIFGRGGDRSVSRIARQVARFRVSLQLGKGRQLLQPVHVDDVAELALRHAARPVPGRFEVGGDEAITAQELRGMIVDVVGRRCLPVTVPASLTAPLAPLAPLARIRPDQLRRLGENKVADISAVCRSLEWHPAPIGNRVEQAVGEALG